MTDRPKILFLHLNQRAQFSFFGLWLASQGWDVTFAHSGSHAEGIEDGVRSLRLMPRAPERQPTDYRYILDYVAENALATSERLIRLRDEDGYVPDVVMAHVGWGVGLCVREIWPHCAYVAYHEWFYTNIDWTRGNKVEKPATAAALVSNRLRNMPISAEFDQADENWCPTEYQTSRFPPALRSMLAVVPDGVDCSIHRPDPTAKIDIADLRLPQGTKVLTYATRGMEPVRGFPQFMRAVERLQQQREDFHTVILAQDVVAYGDKLPGGDSWCKRALAELSLDMSRLHLLGLQPRDGYVRALQASDAHVYFTEPFVTSWSLSEALACGALVIGSNTPPVSELVSDMENGILVDMDDPEEVADMIAWAFDHPEQRAKLCRAARERIVTASDSRHVFPKKEAQLRALIARKRCMEPGLWGGQGR